MCGIAGILQLDPAARVDRADLERMARAMAHRGPDADGFYEGGAVGFAFRRLSIIDRAGSDQPIFNERGTVALVYNGEIYNFQELRAALIAAGHVFRTAGDTETVVHGYEEWGPRGLCERLRGMYAFALHDAERGLTLLVRDRIGIKPLHLQRLPRGVRFASEIKSLLCLDARPTDVDPRAFIDYATLGYVPAPRTIFADVEKLPPGHFALFDASGLRIERYFDVSFRADERAAEPAAERVLELLHECVRSHLVSEVPLGAFLSGGIDSSAVVAAMVAACGRGVNAITVGFDERAFDERAAAFEVARHLGIAPIEERVEQDPATLDAVADTYDEPHADPSDVPTWLLCRAARRHVTVALSGDGGDELFGGYRRYAFDAFENRLRGLLPAFVRRSLLGPLGAIWPKADRLPRPLRAKTLLQNLALDPVDAYARSVSRVKPEEVELLVHPERLRAAGGYRTAEHFRAIDARRGLVEPLLRVRALDLETWLPDDVLAKVDRASMAHSLEVRVPLLDHKLVEFAATLAPSLLMDGVRGKLVFKRALRALLPASTIERRKQGFDLPVDAWLRGVLAPELRALTRPGSPIEGDFDLARARVLLDEHASGRRDRKAELWMLLTWARWKRRWLERA